MRTRKILSLVISAVMVLTMFPLMAFTSVAATGNVYSSGEWNYSTSRINSGRTDFTANGPFFVSFAIADTDFVFMQTQDNQEFTYTTTFYAKKNNFANEAHILNVDTNVENDKTFKNMVTSTSWALTKGQVNDGGDSSPNGDELKTDWFSTYFTGWSYTVNFTANGSAVYHPEWQIEFSSRGAGVGYSVETHNTAYTVIEGESEAQNLDPVFTIQVIDMRELRTLVDMANDVGVDITDITGNRDLSGNTYYSQDVIDTMVSALRARLLCDYTALDTQLARAAAVDENVNGALGGNLFDDDAYNTFTEAYNQAKAVDRFLTDEDDGSNQALINNTALALQNAIDALSSSRKALVSYYADGELFAQNTVPLGKDYNFHDVTDKFIGVPTKEHYSFTKWVDENGERIKEDTVITGDLDVYAEFEVKMEGVAPLEKSGKWEHKLSENDDDGRGDNYISMWVENINFNFVQTHDNETFSFYTDLTAYKNDGGNTVRVNDVYLLPNDTETQTFINALGDNEIEYYCVTKNSDEKPNNTGLPGALGSNYNWQKQIYRVVWRYIYTFNADGHATYNPKWNIEYTSGLWALSAGDHDLPDGGDPYVTFTINVTDMRELLKTIDKAESILNNVNNGFDEATKAALRAVLNDVKDNYTLDGTVYYDQTTVDTQVERIKAYIPDSLQVACDYSVLDEAIEEANAYDREHGNDNNHFIDEVWNDFLSAYEAATTVDRNLYIDDDNVNQPMIDELAENLRLAVKALTYNTHVNQPCDYEDITPVVDAAKKDPGTDNSNGKYDDDAWQDYIDALNNAEDLIDNELYDDEDGENQQKIDDAKQALEDAINALKDPANQNEPCDYSALDEAIAAAEKITDSDLFTPETYQALQDVLDSAKAVPTDLYSDDAGNNQQTIDNAAQALNDAIANLLNDAINNAENTDTTGMTEDSKQALDNAVNDAQAVADNTASTPDDKADAINGITSAADSLTPDKTELEEVINNAESIDTANVPQNLVDALEEAINNGKDVDNNPDATVPEVKNATDDIVNAIDNILQAVTDEAKNTDTDGYTPVTASNLEDAIQNAEDVLNNPDSTPQEKVDAINELTDAINNLNPDKTELEETIDAAETIDTTGLPEDLVNALEDAINNGNNVDGDPDATVPEIKDATDAINDAIDNILQNEIDEAKNTDTDGYTDETKQALEEAIQNAEDVLNNPDSTPQEKVDAINELNDAVDNLTPDKTELEEAINAAKTVDIREIDPQLGNELNDAISDGELVDMNPDATAQEIQDATDAIHDVLDRILQDEIDKAENTDRTGMDPNAISDLEDAIQNAEEVLNNPDSTAQDKVNALDELKDALENLLPDKSGLIDAVNAAQRVYDDAQLNQFDEQALYNAIQGGEEVIDEPRPTVEQVENAVYNINSHLERIFSENLGAAHDEDTASMTKESADALAQAIVIGDAVANNPDATVQDKADAIIALSTALANLTEVNRLIPTDESGLVVDRTDTDCYYLVGLDASNTTFANVKNMFENDGRQIIAFRNDVQLSDTDLIGTGCIIKCVSVKDSSIVYEQATVILYGDVNGDGLIDSVDYDAMFDETLMNIAIEGELFRIAGDVNNDSVIDGFDMSLTELQMTGAKPIDQLGGRIGKISG